MFSFHDVRKWSLAFAEALDAHRIVPRGILLAYGWMVWKVTEWYMSIPVSLRFECQNDVLTTLLATAGMTVEKAKGIACNIADTVGGPTSEQTMFVSIIVGLSGVVIGLYLNSGNSAKWQGNVVGQLQYQYPPTRGGHNHQYGGGDGGYGGYGGGDSTFTPDYEDRRAPRHQQQQQQQPPRQKGGSWMARMRGKTEAPPVDEETPPDLGEDSYQG
jgi:hypothetical protein